MLFHLVFFQLLLGGAIVLARRTAASLGFFQVAVEHDARAADDDGYDENVEEQGHSQDSFFK
jgi:hypothetical protein